MKTGDNTVNDDNGDNSDNSDNVTTVTTVKTVSTMTTVTTVATVTTVTVMTTVTMVTTVTTVRTVRTVSTLTTVRTVRTVTRVTLKLNTDKTELVILYSRFRLLPRLPSIKIETDIIKPTNNARNIGVIFDNTVTMSFHINNIVKVAFYHLRNIAKIRKYINVTTAEVLVHAFINSKLDFCNSLLLGLPKYEINKLQSVQNAAARVIACLSKFDHISDTLKELHWLPVEQRIIFKINLICFKILNNLAPDYLVDLIHVYESSRYLRSSSDKWRLVIKPYN